ncbi:MAG: SDR family NAD(P)-dependent oxidoreductase, partial [Spirochaetota bacterium]
MSANRRYDGALSAVANGVADIWRSRREQPPESNSERLDGSWCLITGASSGLGFETAVRLLHRGADLVVASRSAGPELVRRLRDRVEEEKAVRSAGTTPKIEAIAMDLASFESVEALVEELERRGRQFAVVVFNAGAVASRARRTEDGFDEMLQVNYLSNHLLAKRLIESGCVDLAPAAEDARPARPARPARFVFVSSEAHRSSPDVRETALFEIGAYGMRESVRWYAYSKLLLTAFTEELSRLHNPNDEIRLTVLTMCPGAMRTGIARDAPRILQPLIRPVLRLTFPGPDKSAKMLAHLAVSPEFSSCSGLYFHLSTRKEK